MNRTYYVDYLANQAILTNIAAAQADATQAIADALAVAADLAALSVNGEKIGRFEILSPALNLDIDLGDFQEYEHIEMVVAARCEAGGDSNLLMRLSTDGTTFDTGNNYDVQYHFSQGATRNSFELFAQAGIVVGGTTSIASLRSASKITLPFFTDTSYQQNVKSVWGTKLGTATGEISDLRIEAWWRNNAAVQGVRLYNGDGVSDLEVGTIVDVYGIK